MKSGINRFLSTLALAATIVVTTLNPISATAQNYIGSVTINPAFKLKPLPDFDIIAVTNHNTSGPAAQWRRGSCLNKVRVVVKNWGGDYQYGSTFIAKYKKIHCRSNSGTTAG